MAQYGIRKSKSGYSVRTAPSSAASKKKKAELTRKKKKAAILAASRKRRGLKPMGAGRIAGLAAAITGAGKKKKTKVKSISRTEMQKTYAANAAIRKKAAAKKKATAAQKKAAAARKHRAKAGHRGKGYVTSASSTAAMKRRVYKKATR